MNDYFVNDFSVLILELSDAILLDLSIRSWGDELVLLFQKAEKKYELVFSLCDHVEYTTDASVAYYSKRDGSLLKSTRIDVGKIYKRDDLQKIPYYYHSIEYQKKDDMYCFTLDVSMMNIQVVCKDLYINGMKVCLE